MRIFEIRCNVEPGGGDFGDSRKNLFVQLELISLMCYNAIEDVNYMIVTVNYKIVEDIKFFLEAEKTDIETLSKKANISKTLIYEILKKGITTKQNYERIYSYMYSLGYRINKVKEEFLKETSKTILFHGSKYGLRQIQYDGSRKNCDFGEGFYLGETYDNAVCFVCENDNSSVYSFKLSSSKLNVVEFACSLEWMLAICYYRGTIKEYSDAKIVKQIIEKVENADVIIAPIADNRMFYIMSLFANGDINSEVAVHSLSASFMGKQIVLKTKKALNSLKAIEKYYLCQQEKDSYIKFLSYRTNEIETKLKMAKREYKNGLYIEELLK